jgi:hypothetical protein
MHRVKRYSLRGPQPFGSLEVPGVTNNLLTGVGLWPWIKQTGALKRPCLMLLVMLQG